jgi:hypothetical protein
VNASEQNGQRIRALRNHDEMHMIRHQAVSQHADARFRSIPLQQPKVGLAVRRRKEHLLSSRPSLRDVVSKSGEDAASVSSHGDAEIVVETSDSSQGDGAACVIRCFCLSDDSVCPCRPQGDGAACVIRCFCLSDDSVCPCRPLSPLSPLSPPGSPRFARFAPVRPVRPGSPYRARAATRKRE